MKYNVSPLVAALTLCLGVHKGQLALLRIDSRVPVRIYPVEIRVLPPADQLSLTSGIEITDRLQLARLLEDYLS